MSRTHINRPRPNKCIDIILDNDYNKIVPKPSIFVLDIILNILETVMVFLILVNLKRWLRSKKYMIIYLLLVRMKLHSNRLFV